MTGEVAFDAEPTLATMVFPLPLGLPNVVPEKFASTTLPVDPIAAEAKVPALPIKVPPSDELALNGVAVLPT